MPVAFLGGLNSIPLAFLLLSLLISQQYCCCSSLQITLDRVLYALRLQQPLIEGREGHPGHSVTEIRCTGRIW